MVLRVAALLLVLSVAAGLHEACPDGDAACGARALAPELLAEDKSGSTHLVQLQAAHLKANSTGQKAKSQKPKETIATLVAEPAGTEESAQVVDAAEKESKPEGKKKSKDAGKAEEKKKKKKKEKSAYRLAGNSPDAQTSKDLLDKRGKYLGFSRDFWILLVICAGGMMSIILITFVNVSIGVGLRGYTHCNGPIPKDDKGHIKQPQFSVGWVQRNVLRADLNPSFAYKADMALRSAFAIAGVALPYYIPSLQWVNDYGFSFNYAAVIICFTIYGDIGTTLSLAWYNFAGTVLPTLNILFMFGTYPDGATELYSNAWWFGVMNFVIFIALQMMLRWPTGVRMFAVSWQAYFSMCFINPNDDTPFSEGIRNVILEGAAVGPLVGTVIGCVIAVLCMCTSPLGYCFSALTNAQETALTLAWEESRQWRRMIKYYSSKDSTVAIDKLCGEAASMGEDVLKLEGHLGANSWWECFDLGQAGKVRAHLQSLDAIMNQMHDWLRGTLQAMKEEDFSDQHDAMLDILGPKLAALSDASSELFYRAVRAACHGGVMPDERDVMQQDIDKVLEAQKDLAKEFIAARRKVYEEDALKPDALGEHFFAFALSMYGQYVSDFAQSMMNNEIHSPQSGLVRALWDGVKDTLTFMSPAYAVRSSFGFFLAFAIGLRGIEGMLTPWNSTPAGTTAYLMASEGKGGSAILKNIARFQGTAGGTLLGQLIFCAMVSCTVRGEVCGLLAVTVLEFLSMYLYFASSSFGYVGLLLGAFGASHLLISCDSGESSEEVYGVMLQQFLAILSVTIADLCIGNVSSATLAVQAYCKMSDAIGQSLKEFLCLHLDSGERSDIPPAKSHRKEVLAHYANVDAQGHEAPLEPRWYRTPWRGTLWNKMEKFTLAISDQMAVMEYAALEGHAGGGARRATVDSANMREASDAVFHRAQSVFLLCEKLMMHENNAPFDLPKPLLKGLLSQKSLNLESRLPDILKDVNELLKHSDEDKEPLEKLTQDDSCQVGTYLLMLDYLMKNLNKIEDALFTSRELLLNK